MIFDKLNDRFFGGELSGVPIVVSPNARKAASFNPAKKIVYDNSVGRRGMYVFSESIMSMKPIDICVSMLRLMIYQYAEAKDIKVTSRESHYHNRRFAKLANEHGLIAMKDGSWYGYCAVAPNAELSEWCAKEFRGYKMGIYCYNETKTTGLTGESETDDELRLLSVNPNSHSHKIVCPICGNSVRSTKTSVEIACVSCIRKKAPHLADLIREFTMVYES